MREYAALAVLVRYEAEASAEPRGWPSPRWAGRGNNCADELSHIFFLTSVHFLVAVHPIALFSLAQHRYAIATTDEAAHCRGHQSRAVY
jgi:hypothetical protein